MEDRPLICIVCPLGCRLNIVKDDSQEKGYLIQGNKCQRGLDYAIEEMINPTRMLPTTVAIKGAILNRLPVRTAKPIPKELIMPCMEIIARVQVEAPVRLGDVVIENILDTGVDIVASRSMMRDCK